jgi:hypothetical protein
LAFVDEVVVLAAQWEQVLEVRRAALLPLVEVVDVAVTEANRAVGCGAGAVQCSECSPLIGSGEAFGSSDVDDSAVAVQDDRDDVGFAGQPANGCWWEWLAVERLTLARLVEAGAEGVEVDEHEDLGRPPCTCDRGGDDHRHEGVGAELVERPGIVGLRTLRGDCRVEHGREPCVGLRVEADLGVAHTFAVGPPAHRPL